MQVAIYSLWCNVGTISMAVFGQRILISIPKQCRYISTFKHRKNHKSWPSQWIACYRKTIFFRSVIFFLQNQIYHGDHDFEWSLYQNWLHIGSNLFWSLPSPWCLISDVCFLLMNYSTALHPIKNFPSKTLLPELINEEAAGMKYFYRFWFLIMDHLEKTLQTGLFKYV